MMNPGLSFIVGGIARSGTTALAHALNLHPNLFCSHEAGYAFARSGIPSDIVQEMRQRVGRLPANTNQGKSLVAMEVKLASGTLKLLGDKVPDYALHFNRLARKFPTTKRLCIIRDAPGFARSSDVRAEIIEDKGWHRGQIGLFAILDLLILVDGLATSNFDTYVVSNSRLFRGGPEIFSNLIEEVFEIPMNPEVEEQFVRYFLNKKLPPSAASEPNRYDKLMEAIRVHDLTAAIHRLGLFTSMKRSAMLGDYLRDVTAYVEEPAREVFERLPEETQRVAAEYGSGWLPRRMPLLRAGGASSNALADAIEGIFRAR